MTPLMTKHPYSVFNDQDSLFEYLASELLSYSHLGQPQHISLSGGSTPKGLFHYIVSSRFKRDIQWQHLHFWWGDERCVDFADEQSNYGEAQRLLFDHVDIPKQNLHAIPLDVKSSIEDYHLVAEAYASRMKKHIPMNECYPVYDWVLLGVGTDGHTASLFPEQCYYDDQAIALCVLKPGTNEFRVTLSAKAISAAKRISYLALGLSKASVMSAIIKKQGLYQHYPAANIYALNGSTEYLLDTESGHALLHSEIGE